MISIEEKQSKICELNQLISQRKNAEQKQNLGTVLTDYETYLLTTPYQQWMRITTMLQDGEIYEDIYEDFLINPERYIMEQGQIIFNENWEKEAEEKELERISKLTCTKRIFALILEEIGIDYLTQLKPLIESNSKAQLEWDLCSVLERGNQLLDVMAAELNITSEILDGIFKLANKEISEEEFKSLI